MTSAVLLGPHASKTVKTQIKLCIADFINTGSSPFKINCEGVEFKISTNKV